ncbi:hypothetical protein ACOME3_004399 [Neoechinorhynchus agilis]
MPDHPLEELIRITVILRPETTELLEATARNCFRRMDLFKEMLEKINMTESKFNVLAAMSSFHFASTSYCFLSQSGINQ